MQNDNSKDLSIYNENIIAIKKYFQNGCKKQGKESIGVEIEHFVAFADTNAPVNYSGANGVNAILRAIQKHFEEQGYVTLLDNTEQHLVSLRTKNCYISLEPGAQLEMSLGTFISIRSFLVKYNKIRAIIDPVLKEFGYVLITKGYRPVGLVDDIELLPSARYQIMDEYFKKIGGNGIHMMRQTAATQVSIDYFSEEDFIKKFRLANVLTPFFAFITDNSTVFENKDSRTMVRTTVWENVDPDRAGFTHDSLDRDNFGFEGYARYVLDRPPLMITNSQKAYEPTYNLTSREIFNDHILNTDEIQHLLSLFFPYVRLKNYIEIRMADSMPIYDVLGFIALIKGIFYSTSVLDKLCTRFSSINKLDAINAFESLKSDGIDAVVYGSPIVNLMTEISLLAENELSLKERTYLSKFISGQMARKLTEITMHKFDYDSAVLVEILNSNKTMYQFATDFVDVINSNLDTVSTDFRKAQNYLKTSSATFTRGQLQFLAIPKLFPIEAIQVISMGAQLLSQIIEKVTTHYLNSPPYRQLFGFQKELEELILASPEYNIKVPIARVDIFFNEDDYSFKFCEFNTDGASAMNEDRELVNAWRTSTLWHKFRNIHDMYTFELFDTLPLQFKKLLSEHKTNSFNSLDKIDETRETTCIPYVAIVDFLEISTKSEFVVFKEAFERAGFKCNIIDIRDLHFDGNYLRDEAGLIIDAIYRRAVTSECMDRISEINDFIQAVLQKKVCLIGAFRTQVVHNKNIFRILHLDKTKSFLTHDEIEFINQHIPRTYELKTGLFDYDDVINNKDKWLIKPSDKYGSYGVEAGLNCSLDEWVQIINDKINTDYILQEYCTPFKTQNFYYNDKNEPVYDMYNNMTGIFLYNGKVAGLYSRLMTGPVTTKQDEGRVAPTILACPSYMTIPELELPHLKKIL